MVIKNQEMLTNSFDVINDFSDPISQEYINEPVIQKLLRQQEKLSRFKDISELSYGFFHFPQALFKTIDE